MAWSIRKPFSLISRGNQLGRSGVYAGGERRATDRIRRGKKIVPTPKTFSARRKGLFRGGGES